MKLSRLINQDNLHILKSRNKQKAVTEIFDIASKKHKIRTPKTILKEVLAREQAAPTALGKGVAIPHYKAANLKEIIIEVGMSKAGIDFGAADHVPVKLIFFIVAGESRSREYLKLVAQLAGFVARENLILQNLDFASKELFLAHLAEYDRREMKFKKTDVLQNILKIEAIHNQILSLEAEAKVHDTGSGATINDLVTELKADLKKCEASLDLKFKDRLQRLAARFRGNFMSKIFNNACSSCLSVPSMVDLVKLKRGEIVFCPTCGKVLYLDE